MGVGYDSISDRKEGSIHSRCHNEEHPPNSCSTALGLSCWRSTQNDEESWPLTEMMQATDTTPGGDLHHHPFLSTYDRESHLEMPNKPCHHTPLLSLPPSSSQAMFLSPQHRDSHQTQVPNVTAMHSLTQCPVREGPNTTDPNATHP